MSVQYPPPGHSSTTVIVGARPKNVSSSTGWRAGSLATAVALRAGLPTALTNAGSGFAAAENAADPAKVSRVTADNIWKREICMALPFSKRLLSGSIPNSPAQRHAIVAPGAQGGGMSPLNGIGVAPVT